MPLYISNAGIWIIGVCHSWFKMHTLNENIYTCSHLYINVLAQFSGQIYIGKIRVLCPMVQRFYLLRVYRLFISMQNWFYRHFVFFVDKICMLIQCGKWQESWNSQFFNGRDVILVLKILFPSCLNRKGNTTNCRSNPPPPNLSWY